MKTVQVAIASAFLFLLAAVPGAFAQTVSWRQVVGIIPANNVVGSGTGQIPGGFLPWTTTFGSARVDLRTGEFEFEVKGLVFAGGSSAITIGTPGPITAVKGVLICDNNGSASGGNSVLVETPSVKLSSIGDARFEGHVGSLPAVCSSEKDIAFVVRASAINGQATEGPWIANGAVLVFNDRDRDHDGDHDGR